MVKKVIITFITLLFLVSCSMNITEQENASEEIATFDSGINATGNPMVKLEKAFTYCGSKYGYTWYGRVFHIKVKNVAYDKVISVHHQKLDGSWTDIAATYVMSTPDNYEIWKASTYSTNGRIYNDQFVIKYSVNSATYWDNNNGLNYSMGSNDGTMLGNGIYVTESSHNAYGNQGFSINIDIKNISYNKSVKVVWTDDNWISSYIVDASFQSGYIYGYAWITSPNVHSVERWYATGSVADISKVKFFIEYQVDGQSYYDNNYGHDFTF